MPVILDPDSYDLWLDPGMKDVTVASELLKPYDARLMRSYLISTRINHVANDDAECSQPVEFAPTHNCFSPNRVSALDELARNNYVTQS
jgi:putative SOS response-associated peptidase YedK